MQCLNCGGIFLKKEAIVIEDPSKYVSHELSTQQYQCPLCHSSYYVELEPTTATTTALGTTSPTTVSSVHQPEEESRVTSTECPKEDTEATEDIDHTGDQSVNARVSLLYNHVLYVNEDYVCLCVPPVSVHTECTYIVHLLWKVCILAYGYVCTHTYVCA